ncbi:MAG: hypothetical protein QNJ19_05605 [Woeseiaceae bacterium]|nr:hypothetical protein [Woeseiaceae bacterium]
MIATRNRLIRLWPLLALLLAGPVRAFELEMGAVTLNDTFTTPSWTSVTFLQPFSSTPLVFALPTTDGSDPSTLRIRNVTTSGFQVLQVEPSANDGPHVAMPTAYLAIEPGDHVLPDGSRVVAFEHVTTSFAARFISTAWDSLTFPTAFSTTPAMLGSIQTINNESGNPPNTSSIPFMDVGLRNITTSSFQVTLERAESSAGSVTTPERIAILAIDNAANTTFVDAFSNTIQLQSLRTPANIQGFSNGCFINGYATGFSNTPLAVASANTRNGNNGGWVRRCSQSAGSIGLTIDEDIDNDAERNHTNESAGVVAASRAFHANFEVDLVTSKSVETLSDPVNLTNDPKAIPLAVVGYTISITNNGSLSPDNNSLIITDDIPDELALCITAACLPGGPIVLDTTGSPVPPGVTIGSIEYDDGSGTFSYPGDPDGDGFDPDIDAVRITLSGTLASIGTSGAPSFELLLAARVE